MNLTESELQEMYQATTARQSTADCLDEETLMRASSSDMPADERQRIVEHLRRCSDCARDCQVALSLRPFQKMAESEWNRSHAWMRVAAAAIIALAVPSFVWLIALQQRNSHTIARLQHDLSVQRQITPGHRPAVNTTAPMPRPQFGIPIVDLDADVTREAGGSEPPLVDVPPTADSFALILHLPDDAGSRAVVAELLDSRAASLWHGPVTPDGATITAALNRKIAPAGNYALRVALPAGPVTYRFRVNYR